MANQGLVRRCLDAEYHTSTSLLNYYEIMQRRKVVFTIARNYMISAISWKSEKHVSENKFDTLDF